jgi:hypothetical protein
MLSFCEKELILNVKMKMKLKHQYTEMRLLLVQGNTTKCI